MTSVWLLNVNNIVLENKKTPLPTAATNSNLTLGISTYLGGDNYDYGYGIAVDSKGAIYVTGYTQSSNFPTQNAMNDTFNGVKDAFVTKINPDGSLNYSTYLGGDDDDQGFGIAVSNTGMAYITGRTCSSNFPTLNAMNNTGNGGYDVFLAILNPNGSLNYSTYLGGSSHDYATGIALDSTGAAYLTGYTYSNDFPLKNAIYGDSLYTDGFVTKFNPDGSLNYSTYLGGNDEDNPFGIAVDSMGSVYITGFTMSTDFPLNNAIDTTFDEMYESFVTKLNPDGSLNYSTFLGGDGAEWGYGIAVDITGAAYATGWTYSSDFPTQNAMNNTINGNLDAYLTKFNPNGSLNYSTYFGGNGVDKGMGIAVDTSGAIYVTGVTGSSNFPKINAVDTVIEGSEEAFICKFNPNGSLNYSTFLGGDNNDYAYSIAIDMLGSAYTTGYTDSSDFPTINAIDFTPNGARDVFVTKLRINSPPSVSNVQITPANAYTMQNLQLTYNLFDPDEGDEIDTEIIWYRNGIKQPDYENETTIYAADTEVGDIWNCTIRPFDGTEFGELVWSPNRVILVNDIPTFSRIPNNLTYVFGTTGHLLYWTVSDVAYGSRSYTVTNNNEPYNPNMLTVLGPDIMVNVEFLDIGFYEFNLTYNDGLGGEVSSIVSVTVVESLPPTLWERFLQLLPIIGLVAALIAVGAFVLINKLKKKKI